MRTSSIRMTLATLVLALVGAATLAQSASMTNEDVVRRVLTGQSDEEVIAAIQAGSHRFDLAPDIVVELRKAGVSETVIRAMRRATAAPEPAGRSLPERPSLDDVVGALDSGMSEMAVVRRLEESRPTFELDEAAEERLRAAGAGPAVLITIEERTRRGDLRIALSEVEAEDPEASEIAVEVPLEGRRAPRFEQELSGLAVLVGCTTGGHAPRHWQGETRFTDVPRHRVLWSGEGEVVDADDDGPRRIELALPRTLEVSVTAGAHELVFGVGLRLDGRWELVRAETLEVTVERDATVEIDLQVERRRRGLPLVVDPRRPAPVEPNAGEQPDEASRS